VHVGIQLKDVSVRDRLEGLGIDGKIILNYNYNKQNGAVWTGLAVDRNKWQDVEKKEVIFPIS